MNVERIAIADLVEDPANARTHDAKNLRAIKGSLKRFGQQKPIVIDAKGVVIAGNGTLAAAREIGWTDIDVVRTTLAGAEAIAYAISDNRAGELAGWDDIVLGKALAALDADGWDLTDIGWDDGDWDKPVAAGTEGNTDPDEIPDQAPARTKRGDLWLLGDHRLMCGDSTSAEDVERLMAGEKAELCFTSPPYADQREYGGGKELSTEHLATFIAAAAPSVGLFAVNLGMSRKDGEVNAYWDDYIAAAHAVGLKLLSWNVWDRLNAATIGQQTAMFAIEHEWIFVFGVEKSALNLTIPNKNANQKMGGRGTNRESDNRMSGRRNEIVHEKRRLGTVIRQDIYRGDAVHPAVFPIALPEAYVEACTDHGASVYEPFCGSGSTLIACENTARRCYAMEIDPHYCDIAVERWERFTGKQAVLSP